MKICSKCKQEKSSGEFYNSQERIKCTWCKSCMNENNFKNKLKRRYSISTEQYEQMFKQQGGVCAICSNSCSTGNRLAVDHCHITGRVRGLLCSACNQKLEWFEKYQIEAARYLSG